MAAHYHFEDQILLEDNHLLVIHKPPGWLSQGDKTGDEDVLTLGKVFLKKKYNKPGNVYLAAAHRIDRPVAGVLVLAKTSKAHSRLTKSFRERRVQKTYWAIVAHRPKEPEGDLHHHLVKDGFKNVVKAYAKPVSDSKPAHLRYSMRFTSPQYTLLEVWPITGRSHQIRVQLASIGCPIIGDVKYGAPTALPDASIALLAKSIRFPHPIGQVPVNVSTTPPLHLPWNQIAPIMD